MGYVHVGRHDRCWKPPFVCLEGSVLEEFAGKVVKRVVDIEPRCVFLARSGWKSNISRSRWSYSRDTCEQGIIL